MKGQLFRPILIWRNAHIKADENNLIRSTFAISEPLLKLRQLLLS